MKYLSSIALGFLLAIAFTLSACGTVDETEVDPKVRIGGGNQSGLYQKAGEGIAECLEASELRSTYAVSVQISEGSVSNINALSAGSLEVALVQSDRLYQAYHGFGAWQGEPVDKLRFVCSFYPEVVTLLATNGSGIYSLEDIKGKVVSIGSSASGTKGNVLNYLEAQELVPGKDFVAEEILLDEAIAKMQNGELDAIFCTVGHPNEMISEIVKGDREVHFVPLPGNESLAEMFPYYNLTSIDLSQYPQLNKSEKIPALGVYAILATSSEVNDEKVYAILKSLGDNLDLLKNKHQAFSNLEVQAMLDGISTPLHSGAVKFYKEGSIFR
ncbi:MAG: TRAP transporter TAXI family solute receptor [Chlamydiales bacterium]|jgi:TRAP transporter TAXI family solute receptor